MAAGWPSTHETLACCQRQANARLCMRASSYRGHMHHRALRWRPLVTERAARSSALAPRHCRVAATSASPHVRASSTSTAAQCATLCAGRRPLRSARKCHPPGTCVSHVASHVVPGALVQELGRRGSAHAPSVHARKAGRPRPHRFRTSARPPPQPHPTPAAAFCPIPRGDAACSVDPTDARRSEVQPLQRAGVGLEAGLGWLRVTVFPQSSGGSRDDALALIPQRLRRDA